MYITKHRIGLYSSLLIICLLSFLLSTHNVKGATDSNPPILKAVNIDKKTVSPNETVKIELEFEDDLSGVQSAFINYQIGDISRDVRKFVNVKYNPNTQKWEGFVTPNNFQSGVWSLYVIYAVDNAGNGVNFLRGENTLVPNGNFEVTDIGTTDTKPPTLKSVYIDKKTVNPNETVKIEFELEDDLSGVQSAFINYQIGDISRDVRKFVNVKYNPNTQKWEGFITPNNFQSGVWSLYVIYAVDKAGNGVNFLRGENTLVPNGNFEVTDKIDVTPPIIQLKNIITDQSNVISGTTESGAVITVNIGTKIINSTISDEQGNFLLSIPTQKYGTVLTLFATDRSGNKSEKVNVTVIDKTPPVTPKVNVVTDVSKKITGTSEPNIKITVLIGSIKFEDVTNEKGEFNIKIPQQKATTQIIVTGIDISGNKSEEVNLTVIDKTPPATPKLNVVSDTSKEITGTSEPYAKITVLIGSKKYEEVSNEKGRFNIKIPQQKANTQIIVIAIDISGNVSKNVNLIVLDKTPPVPPKVIINKNNPSVITGTTEAYATITIKVGNKVVGIATANKAGSYIVKINKPKKDTILIITAKDKANNISKPSSVKIK
jgi:hypothetical protein